MTMPREKPEHTPLPWIIRKSAVFDSLRIEAGGPPEDLTANDGYIIAELHGPDRHANARLFMDAPTVERQRDELVELVGYLLEDDPSGEIQVTDRAIANKLPAMYEQTARAAIAAVEKGEGS